MKGLFFFACFVISQMASAQTGEIFGVVFDENNESIMNASVIVSMHGIKMDSVITDFDGRYSVKPLSTGRYDLIVRYAGYQSKMATGSVGFPNNKTQLDVRLAKSNEPIPTGQPRNIPRPPMPPRRPPRPTLQPQSERFLEMPKFGTPKPRKRGIFRRR